MAHFATASAIAIATVCASSKEGSKGRKLSFLLGANLHKVSAEAKIISLLNFVALTARTPKPIPGKTNALLHWAICTIRF